MQNRTYGKINTFESGNWSHSQMESSVQQTNILVRESVIAKVFLTFYFSDPPVFMSAPHFYQGDPSLLDAVNGLNPIKAKHATFVSVEPVGNSMWCSLKIK